MAWTRVTRVVRTDGVLEGQVDGALVVLDPGTGAYAGLEGTAVPIWEALARPIDFGALVDEVARDFGVARSECAPGIASCLETLRRKGLLVISGSDHDHHQRDIHD